MRQLEEALDRRVLAGGHLPERLQLDLGHERGRVAGGRGRRSGGGRRGFLSPGEPSPDPDARPDPDDDQEHRGCPHRQRTPEPRRPWPRRRRLLPRAVPPGLALAPPETHEEPTRFALALRPLPAVLLDAEPPGRQVRVQGFDGLGRHLELALDVPDPAHRSSV